MAKINKDDTFKEFKFNGETFEYSGRIYDPKDGKGKVKKTYGVTLTLNGVFTLKGVKLIQTDNSVFLDYPSFKTTKDGKDTYVSYVYIDKDINSEIDKLAEYLYNLFK